MTTQDNTYIDDRSFFSGLRAAAGHLLLAIADASAAGRCAREAERLSALSDEALARRGLTRDAIVPHAFARFRHL